MAIITISPQFGSSSGIIAEALKEELNFDYLGKVKLEEELVKKYGIPEKNVQKYDGKKPVFWDVFSQDNDRYLHFLKTEMYKRARKGNCIIMGRGGQVLLKDVPGTLHVRVIAPIQLRIERLKQRFTCHDRRAEQLVRRSDHDLGGFHKFFFDVDWGDPDLYDLVVNTRSFSIEHAVYLIRETIDTLGIRGKEAEAERKLADLCIGQEVITRIMYNEKLPIESLNVNVENGVVTLQGSAVTADERDRCGTAARQVPEVKDIINTVSFIPSDI